MIYFGYFLYYSFGVEKTNTFIHSRGSLENHAGFKTIMGQNLYPFSDQNGSKTIPFGAAHTYIAYIGEYSPPGCGFSSLAKVEVEREIFLLSRTSTFEHGLQVFFSNCKKEVAKETVSISQI